MKTDNTLHLEANCLSRLDRLPLNRSVFSIVGILLATCVIEAFDVGIVGQIVLILKQIWNLTPQDTGLLGTSSTMGVVIGTFCCGFLSDKFGRKRVLMWGTFTFTFFTLIGAAVNSLNWVITMRFLGGLGAGAVFPQPYLFVSELVGAKHRGVVFSYFNAILVGGYLLPAGFGAWAVSALPLDTAWKAPFLVGGLPIVMTYVLYKWMPESPRWLMKQGRFDEAFSLLERFERSSGVTPDPGYIDPNIVAVLQRAKEDGAVSTNWRMIFKPPYLSRTVVSYSMFTAALIFWYIGMVYAPTIIKSKGFQMSSSLLMTAVMMGIALLGQIFCGHFIDRFGRKVVYVISAGLGAVCCILLTQLESLTGWLIVGAWLAFWGNAPGPISKIYLAEQYPTQLRGTGSGLGETTARIMGGVFAAYYVSFILTYVGQNAVFWFQAVAFAAAIVILLIWGQETARRSVDATGGSLEKVPAPAGRPTAGRVE